ncbi:hypothetical protein [Thalassotalea crassostreae]|uniref:hypothetical protein n=1 Tax=Thalassotalea crassostreae TaxID=1763536 RepID=UPI0008397813|nr:hypothetical protein [Thalassotalea crassostreae]
MKTVNASIITTLIATMFTSTLTQATERQQPLAKVNWLQNLNQVKQDQSQQPEDELANRLTYKSELFDIEFHQEFLFDDQGKLKNVLFYKGISKDNSTCVDDYESIKKLVEQQYGKVETASNTYTDLTNTPKEQLCKHAADGVYQLESKWTTDNSNISFVLNTWKGQAYIGLSYKPL